MELIEKAIEREEGVSQREVILGKEVEGPVLLDK